MMLLRRSMIALACLAAGVALVSCGGSEKKSSGAKPAPKPPAKPEVLSFEATGGGKDTKLDGPATAKAGLVKLRVTNSAKGSHTAQILSIGAGHSVEEALTAGEAWGEKGTPLPPWIKFHGGVGSLDQGETASVTLALEPGKYVAVDIEAESGTAVKEFDVKGAAGKLPKGKGTITASDYKFKGSKLTAGSNEILFKNAGKEPHHLLAAPIKEGKTIEDVQKFFTDEEGDAPIDEKRAVDTGILEGGTEQLLDVKLDSGRYVMFCFIPDRKGGPPHAFKGMISEVAVQ